MSKQAADTHDHGPALSDDAYSPAADACTFALVSLPCGCQDVHWACGYIDREHDHVICDSWLDVLADQLAIGILLEAFGIFGITRRACDLAAEAVLATDAIAANPDGTLLPRGES